MILYNMYLTKYHNIKKKQLTIALTGHGNKCRPSNGKLKYKKKSICETTK
jgi:hypothetical protein